MEYLIVMNRSAAGAESETYLLQVNGKAMFLDRVSINGKQVLGGTLVSLDLPLPVTKYLRNGANTLEIEYTSDNKEGLAIFLEKRSTVQIEGTGGEMVRW